MLFRIENSYSISPLLKSGSTITCPVQPPGPVGLVLHTSKSETSISSSGQNTSKKNNNKYMHFVGKKTLGVYFIEYNRSFTCKQWFTTNKYFVVEIVLCPHTGLDKSS